MVISGLECNSNLCFQSYNRNSPREIKIKETSSSSQSSVIEPRHRAGSPHELGPAHNKPKPGLTRRAPDASAGM